MSDTLWSFHPFFDRQFVANKMNMDNGNQRKGMEGKRKE